MTRFYRIKEGCLHKTKLTQENKQDNCLKNQSVCNYGSKAGQALGLHETTLYPAAVSTAMAFLKFSFLTKI